MRTDGASEQASMYDLIIIGASAAGLSAAVYAQRRKLNFLVVGADIGGEMALSGEIENWPGVVHTTGIELTDEFLKQAKANNIPVKEGIRITEITLEGNIFLVEGEKDGTGFKVRTKTVLVSTGVHPRELGVPGEKELRAKGLSYCTVCDGPLFGGKVVTTIGGGNSALESAIMMAEIASYVYVINKNPQFKGDAVLIDKVTNELTKKNVEIIYNALATRILGDGFVSGVEYKDAAGNLKTLKVDGVFVHIGMIPNSDLVPKEVERNEYGEVKVDITSRTNLPGFFAAGDITNVPYKQLAIASGQGVAAALSAVDYLNKLAD